MASPSRKTYETPQPWETRQGALVDRVAKVNREAARVYAQQEALLPTIHHEHDVDPAVGDHLQDLGKRVQILRENARRPDKTVLKIAERLDVNKRVIPSRFPEEVDDDEEEEEVEEEEEEEENGEDAVSVQGRIETMLMDQEWDTRTWNKAKICVAVETLYEQVEHSDDPRRRALATTMLVRLLETHESAVECVESTIPILMNKAFRSLSKIVDKTRTFRVCTLVSVLAEWFAPILSRDNAMGKSMAFLLRETELCARIVQHHWRGVLFERRLSKRDIDASVRARLRSMHFVKNIELRHQFKVLRDAMGPRGLPIEALQAYVKILLHLVKPTATAVDKNRHHVATADQKRLLGSGILVVLASLIPTAHAKIPPDQQDARRAITEYIKTISLELTVCFGHEADKVIEIMKSNIIQRVIGDLDQHLTTAETSHLVHTCLQPVAAIAKAVWQLYNQQSSTDDSLLSVSAASSRSCDSVAVAETAFLLRRMQTTALQFLMTSQVMEILLRVLPLARQRQDAHMCELALSTLRYLSGSYGFKALLDALTRNGGRALEQVVLCFEYDAAPSVVRAAVALFHDMTNHPDARAGFTTAGAALMLCKRCESPIETAKNQARFVLALCGIAWLARQHPMRRAGLSAGSLFDSLGSLEMRLEALYAILLELVSGSSRDTRGTAVYVHTTVGVFVPILLRFLVQVKPSDIEPAIQTRKQRSISCIVLSRLFKVPALAAAAFGESTVVHLALSLQCNRLDEVEGKLRRSNSTEDDRRLHFLGLKEACKALSRLARCPAHGGGADVSLRPTITSVNVPLLPQAIVCDVVTRMHVLEDILPLIHIPTEAAEFLDIDVTMVDAAIELVGYLRPMPYGEAARQQFLKTTETHAHGKYAHERLEMLVTIAAPVVLHVLKEKNCGDKLVATCCAALSRLAATNQCRSLLLSQGALFIALTHVPEVLYDSQSASKRSGGHSPIRCDASVDDRGLLDVPASLFTLLAKLCAIADGRTAIMKAQVLPRVLKRLQLVDVPRPNRDLEVKSEIAVLVQRLAICNAVEGNTSELFLHFRVVELLSQIVVDHSHAFSCGRSRSPTRKAHASTDKQNLWGVLDQVAGAIAALAQDFLVCVPKIVHLDVLSRLAPLLTIDKLGNDFTGQSSSQHHIAALRYHVVNVARAVAAYPLGEYHAYLMRVQIGRAEKSGQIQELTFMERIKKIAFDFTLELQGGAPAWSAGSDGQKTIGELAREILALVREREQRDGQQHQRKSTSHFPVAVSSGRPASPHVATAHRVDSPTMGLPSRRGSGMESPAFPPLSPKQDIRTLPSGRPGSGSSETPTKSSRSAAPLPQSPSVVTAVGCGIQGVDLLSTRPPPKPPISVTESHYIFARPKQNQLAAKKSKSRRSSSRDATEQFLMLDPLFQNAPPQHERRHHRSRERVEETGGEGEGFVFLQDVSHYGHQVNLKARRSRLGDKYIPSIGHLHVEDPTMNVLRRK